MRSKNLIHRLWRSKEREDLYIDDQLELHCENCLVSIIDLVQVITESLKAGSPS